MATDIIILLLIEAFVMVTYTKVYHIKLDVKEILDNQKEILNNQEKIIDNQKEIFKTMDSKYSDI